MRKIVIAGDSGVGKSTLIYRLAKNVFKSDIGSTVGAQFSVLERKTLQGDQVAVWDTAGSQQFTHVLPIYFRNCELLVFCFRFDYNDERSLEYVQKAWQDASACGVKKVILVATQCDRWSADDSRRMRRDVQHVNERFLGILGAEDGVEVTSSATGEGIAGLVESIYRVLEEAPSARDLVDAGGHVVFTTGAAPLKKGGGGCAC